MQLKKSENIYCMIFKSNEESLYTSSSYNRLTIGEMSVDRFHNNEESTFV